MRSPNVPNETDFTTLLVPMTINILVYVLLLALKFC